MSGLNCKCRLEPGENITNGFNKMSDSKPVRGQRCLIWNPMYDRFEFACWSGEYWYHAFYGITKRVSAIIKYWLPETDITKPEPKGA